MRSWLTTGRLRDGIGRPKVGRGRALVDPLCNYEEPLSPSLATKTVTEMTDDSSLTSTPQQSRLET